MSEKLKELISLLYQDKLTQCGKRLLVENIEKLQKENKKLKNENIRLRNIRNEYKYGIENTHLITKSDLVQIDINKYMIEIENGRFVDLKQVYQENIELKKENEKLHKEIDRMKSLDIYKLVEDWETGQLIPRQKIKDKIEKLIEELKQDDINMTRKYKEKKNITGELLGIDKVRVRAYREKTREINEKLHKLLIETIETKGEK